MERAVVWLRRNALRKQYAACGRAAQSARRISARVDRARACGSDALVAPAIAAAAAVTERTGGLPATTAGRALVWLRRNAQRRQHAASRACRPKRSRNFRRRGSSVR